MSDSTELVTRAEWSLKIIKNFQSIVIEGDSQWQSVVIEQA
jgi:hypothetical protein